MNKSQKRKKSKNSKIKWSTSSYTILASFHSYKQLCIIYYNEVLETTQQLSANTFNKYNYIPTILRPKKTPSQSTKNKKKSYTHMLLIWNLQFKQSILLSFWLGSFKIFFPTDWARNLRIALANRVGLESCLSVCLAGFNIIDISRHINMASAASQRVSTKSF